jgi:putative redox protein
MRVEVRHDGGIAFVATTPSGHKVVVDGRAEVGGADRGPRPKELLLVSLGTCTGMDVVSILQKMRQPVSAFSIDVEGRERSEHPRVFEELTLVYRIDGAGLEPEKAARAVLLSQERYCGVSAMLRQASALAFRLVVNGQEVPLPAEAGTASGV